MNPFEGYQGRGPVEGRPWWRVRQEGDAIVLVRAGHRTVALGVWNGFDSSWREEARLKAIAADREHPRPCPPPMVGQVWRFCDGYAVAIAAVGKLIKLAHEGPLHSREGWPVPHAVLVYGPGSPWAPADYQPEDEKVCAYSVRATNED